MAFMVAVIGFLILSMGAAVIISPQLMKTMLSLFLQRNWWYVAMAVRIVMGILLFVAAPDTRSPSAVRVIGVLFILAGALIPVMGKERIEAIVAWWMERSDGVIRGWGVAAGVFGAVVIWLGL